MCHRTHSTTRIRSVWRTVVRCCFGVVLVLSCRPAHAQRVYCAADCDSSAVVSIDELVRAVGIALNAAAVGSCVAADGDRDGEVKIDELISGVESALEGCGSRALTTDDLFLEVGERIPQFAGLYFDGDTPTILLTDTSAPVAEAARSEIRRVFSIDNDALQAARVLPADFTFKELQTARVVARALLSVPGVSRLGVDERRNRVSIAISDMAMRASLEARLRDAGVALDRVIIELGEAVSAHQSLRDQFKVGGGLQIQNANGTCTAGFVAKRGGQRGLVTNSHCTEVQGGVEGTMIGQPSLGIRTIGIEVADPSYFSGGDACPSGRRCRLSDSSFIALNPTVTGERGLVYRPAELGSIDLGAAYLRTFTRYLFFVGDGALVEKVGRTSGRTAGKVKCTCEDINVTDTDITLLCQHIATYESRPGDSGSPVYKPRNDLDLWTPGHNTLVGINWGGGDGHGAFSPLGSIMKELGVFEFTYGNESPEVQITEPSNLANVPYGGFTTNRFQAKAFDFEDGEECCTFSWHSSVEGELGEGQTIEASFESLGIKEVSVTATDSASGAASDSVLVVATNTPPVAIIDDPPVNATIYRGATYRLRGHGDDVNEVAVACENLTWKSSRAEDPLPRTGCSVDVSFSTTGPRIITLSASDEHAARDEATVLADVVDMEMSETEIQILEPEAGVILSGATVRIAGNIFVTDSTGVYFVEVLTRVSSNPLQRRSYRPLTRASGAFVGTFETIWEPDAGCRTYDAEAEVIVYSSKRVQGPDGPVIVAVQEASKSVVFRWSGPPC